MICDLSPFRFFVLLLRFTPIFVIGRGHRFYTRPSPLHRADNCICVVCQLDPPVSSFLFLSRDSSVAEKMRSGSVRMPITTRDKFINGYLFANRTRLPEFLTSLDSIELYTVMRDMYSIIGKLQSNRNSFEVEFKETQK